MNLPNDWTQCNLTDICSIRTGKYDANHAVENGKYRFYTCSTTYSFCNTKSFEGECIIVPGNGDIGQVYYYDGEFEAYQRTYVLEKIYVLPRYLYYHLFWNWRHINSDKQYGSTIRYVRIGNFEKYIVSLPPLPEQHRIVAKIDSLFSELDNGVALLKTIKAQLAIYRQAVLKWAFEGKLTAERRKEKSTNISVNIEKAPQFLTDNLMSLPEEWSYVFLSKLGDLSRGKSKHRPRNDSKLFENGKYPFIQTGDVKAAKGYIKNFSTQYGEFGLKQSKLWKAGTLCITIAANIAETAFLAIDACFPDSIVGFTADTNVVEAKYVDYFIQSAKLKLWAFAPATAQKNINLEILENLIIPYCPKPEQLAIVSAIESRLSVCDKLEQTIDQTLTLSASLRQSILKKAFEGRLVPQDSNDEPAEKLLERINAQKQHPKDVYAKKRRQSVGQKKATVPRDGLSDFSHSETPEKAAVLTKQKQTRKRGRK